MAQMQSREEDIDNDDEREVFRLLNSQLDDCWIVWHEPELRRLRSQRKAYRPDFILLHPGRGLFVLEVKGWQWGKIGGFADDLSSAESDTQDWRRPRSSSRKRRHSQARERRGASNQLENPKAIRRVKYRYNDGEQAVEAPGDQLKKYKTEIRRNLRDSLHGVMAQRHVSGAFDGRLLFVRISNEDIQTSDIFDDRLDAVRRRIVNQEERYLADDLRDWKQSGKKLERAVSCQPDASLNLSPDVMDRIRQTIHPESKIHTFAEQRDTSQTDGVKESAQNQSVPDNSKVLDLEQEQIARNFVGRGHRILFGVAGSGKTVILIARAKYQSERHPDHSILVLCFNKALSLYLEAALRGYSNIAVKTFHDWARIEFRMQRFGEEKDEAYDAELIEHLEQHGAKARYDCILIDESQDWNMAWFQAILHAAKDAEHGDLLIAGDGSQTIYARHQGFSWAKCGIKAQGRVINRRGGRINTFRNYRNTPETVALATHFAKSYVADGEASEIMSLLPDPADCGKLPSRHLPVVSRFEKVEDELVAVRDAVRLLVTYGGYERKDIAILCPKYKKWQEAHLPKLVEFLNEHDVEAKWINTKDRNHEEILADSVSVASVMLVKGLEFKACFLVGVDQFDFESPDLLYVALTRATERLHVSGSWTGKATPLVRQLLSDVSLFINGQSDDAWMHGLMPRERMVPLGSSSNQKNRGGTQDKELDEDIPF